MRIFIEFINKTKIIYHILLYNIPNICSTESYHSYANTETCQNPHLRTEPQILSSRAFPETYDSNTCKENSTPYNKPNCAIQSSYRPSYMFESEFTTTTLPCVEQKTSEFEQRTPETKRLQGNSTNHGQALYDTFDHSQGWLIPSCYTPWIDYNPFSCHSRDNSQHTQKTYNYIDSEIQKKPSCMYHDQESSYTCNHKDQEYHSDIYVEIPNYYRDNQKKLDSSTDEIHQGCSLNPYTHVKNVYPGFNQLSEFIDNGELQEPSVVLPALESTEYIFSDINTDTVNNDTVLKNTSEETRFGNIQNVCHYHEERIIEGTTIQQASDFSLQNYRNCGATETEILPETPNQDLYLSSLTIPICGQYNTKPININPYNSNIPANKYTDNDTLPLDINTTYRLEHPLLDTRMTPLSTKRSYNDMYNEACALDNDTHTVSHSTTKHVRKDNNETKIFVTETFQNANTTGRKLDYNEYFNFTLNDYVCVFKRAKDMSKDKTIILSCSVGLPPKTMDITYEDFRSKYIHQSWNIKKLSFSFNVPLFIPLKFKISGPLKYLKLSSVLTEQEINQNIYGIAYFGTNSESYANPAEAQIVLENTIPRDLSCLIELIMNSEFPIYNFSGVKYDDVLTFKRIGELPSEFILSTREFLDGLGKQELFINYYKNFKYKYNSILDIPIRKQSKNKYSKIAWDPSIYVITLAILDIRFQLERIEEIISNSNLTEISKKSNIKLHIKNIIDFFKIKWKINYTVDNNTKYQEKVNILSFFYFLRQRVRQVLEYCDKYILTDKMIKFIENEDKRSTLF